jgi:sodium transport system ATP-binding protein
MIEAVGLKKRFKTKQGLVQAVDGVSFTANDGEITGLLGPNGAGKTTTLRMLYTLMSPDEGHVRIDGRDASQLDARAHLGVLPDARGIYKRWSARENVEYFARLQGVPDAAPRGSHRASAPRRPSRARSFTTRRTSFSTNRPTAST